MSHLLLVRSPPTEPPVPPTSDAELVASARAGSRRGQEALFRKHVARAAALGHKLLGRSPSDVDDLLQDAFEVAFRRLDTLREPAAFGGWLQSIVVRVAIKRLRHKSLLNRLGLASSDIDSEAFCITETRPETVIELRRLDSYLQRFPKEERVVLLLSRVEGRDHQEIAELLGLSRSTVRRRLGLAEARLERYLSRDRATMNPSANMFSGHRSGWSDDD